MQHKVGRSIACEQTDHLINTQKTLKGCKLTLRDSIRRHQLKTTQSNRRRSIKNQQKQDQKPPSYSDYTEKYKGLQTIQDQYDLAKFIVYQRAKQSRSSSRGMKLFSRQSSRPGSSPNRISGRKSQSSRVQKVQTFQTSRSSKANTIEYQVSNSLTENKQTTGIQFTSKNLDKRMNEYLNLVLRKKSKDDIVIHDKEIKMQLFSRNKHIKEYHQQQVKKSLYHQLAGDFYRKLKKKNKAISTCQSHLITIEANGSSQLVKQLKKQRQFNKSKGYYSQNQYLDSGRVDEMISRVTARSFKTVTRDPIQIRGEELNTISTLPYDSPLTAPR